MNLTNFTKVKLPEAALQHPDVAATGSLIERQQGDIENSSLVVIAESPMALQSVWQDIAPKLLPNATVLSHGFPIMNLPEVDPVDDWYTYDLPSIGYGIQFDASHVLTVFHPQYDGFLNLRGRALFDIKDLRLEVDESIRAFVEPHFLPGQLLAGQERAIDLELHPVHVPQTGARGFIHVFDGTKKLASRVEILVATSRSVDCEVAVLNNPQAEIVGTSSRTLIREIMTINNAKLPWWKRLWHR